MSIYFRTVLLILMSLALFFGFLNLFLPETSSYDFNRLHIFLFNLCTGGAILLYFTEGKKEVSTHVKFFLILTIAYAVCAFLKIYIPVLVITVALFIIVETLRIRRFSLFFEGMMFAILLANALMPLIEYIIDNLILPKPKVVKA